MTARLRFSRLTMRETLTLADIIRARYTASGLSNQEFADSINADPTERAAFRSDVTRGNVVGSLEALGIEPNLASCRPGGDDVKALAARVEALEQAVRNLTEALGGPPKK